MADETSPGTGWERYKRKMVPESEIDRAEKKFLKAIQCCPETRDAFANLGTISLQRNDMAGAAKCFEKALAIDPMCKENMFHYADILRETGRLHDIMPVLEKVLEVNPKDNDVLNLTNEIRAGARRKRKVGVLCLPGLESFLKDIVGFLESQHEVVTCYSGQEAQIEYLVRWADIVWLEWGNELAVQLTNRPGLLENKRVICRIHSYEAMAGYARAMRWDSISDVIFVAEHIARIVRQQVPNLDGERPRIHIVPNGIDLERFPFRNREKGNNLAYVGSINYKKGPMLLFHAFRELAKQNDAYRLHIAGSFQDTRYELYFRQMADELDLKKNIVFSGWVDDVAGWLDDKQYIICTSVLEGHPVGLMEAMACGLKPVIHNYVGARGTYPDKYIWNTIDEFVERVQEDDYDSSAYRREIENRYSLVKQLNQIEKILNICERSTC